MGQGSSAQPVVVLQQSYGNTGPASSAEAHAMAAVRLAVAGQHRCSSQHAEHTAWCVVVCSGVQQIAHGAHPAAEVRSGKQQTVHKAHHAATVHSGVTSRSAPCHQQQQQCAVVCAAPPPPPWQPARLSRGGAPVDHNRGTKHVDPCRKEDGACSPSFSITSSV